MSTAQNPTRLFARPAFPVLQQSSPNSSTFQSYSSTTSLASQSPASAPLPSPSHSTHPEQQSFFSSLNEQQAQQQQSQPMQQQQPQNVQSPSTFSYQPNRQGAGQTAAETTNYLNQAALLAEAAKRAQMAVLMRDVEGMEL